MDKKRFEIEMEVLSPLYIGAGNETDLQRGADFIQMENKIYVLDITKAVQRGVDIDHLTALFLQSDHDGIRDLMGKDIIAQCAVRVYDNPLSDGTPINNPVKSIIRTQLYDCPLVPGSSLKGAIRSALFKHLRSKVNDEKSNDAVFGGMRGGIDLMRFIQISDIEIADTVLVNSKIFNLHDQDGTWVGGWKHGAHRTTNNFAPTGFNTLYECVKPGSKGYGTFVFDGKVHQSILNNNKINHAKERANLMEGGLRTLFAIINAHTKEYLRKEKEFFLRYPSERTDDIVEQIDSLLESIPNDNSSCVLKMSAGAGFHIITGDWRYDDYCGLVNNQGKKYKSRKTANYNGKQCLMGFVKLRALTSDEAYSVREALANEHKTIIRHILDARKEKEEREKSTRAKQEQQKRERQEVILKEDEYARLKENASQSLLADQWDEAIKLARQAHELFPERRDDALTELINNCNTYKRIAMQQQQEEKDKAEKFAQPLSTVLQGKTSVGNIVGTTAKWLKIEGHTFGEEELTTLETTLRQLPEKELSKLKGKRGDLKKALGEQLATRVLTDLGLG